MSFTAMPGWFAETNEQWPGAAMALEVEEILHDVQSEYQHVVVFKSKSFGNVLLLDGVIQITDRDEMAYQEPIAHIPLFSHPNPKSVLVVGGGDGGVLREVVKHASVEKVVICEIDQEVINAARKFFPFISSAYDHPKVTLICGDASKYIKDPQNSNQYDVIIADTSDPIGPAADLFKRPFYSDLAKALKAGGVITTQGESMWNNVELIASLIKEVKDMNIFESVEYATTQIPTYPLGQIGFIVCKVAGEEGKKDNSSCKIPVRAVPEDMDLRYYNSELHSAAFALPTYLKKALSN